MSKKKIALVTGAGGGLGREFVRKLLEEDVEEIWAVARNKEKLEKLIYDYGERIKIFPVDLTVRENIAHLQERLAAEGDISIRFLVNNAGFAKFCSYYDISVEESLNMMDLNMGAVVALGLVCIPYMESGSYMINIASLAAFFPLPYQNIYSSTKAFVRNYTRALNVELKDKKIHAIAVCPGWIKTELYERAMIGAKKGTTVFSAMTEPEVVVGKALKDAKKGRDISVYGAFAKSAHFFAKIIPQRIVMKLWVRMQKLN